MAWEQPHGWGVVGCEESEAEMCGILTDAQLMSLVYRAGELEVHPWAYKVLSHTCPLAFASDV